MNQHLVMTALLAATTNRKVPTARHYEHKSGKWRVGSHVQRRSGGSEKRARNKARRQAIALHRKLKGG